MVLVALPACADPVPPLPPGPPLPVSVLAELSDDWVLDADAVAPGGSLLSAPLSEPGALEAAWQTDAKGGPPPEVAPVPGADRAALLWSVGRSRKLVGVSRTLDVGVAPAAVAQVSVWEGGLQGPQLSGAPRLTLRALDGDGKSLGHAVAIAAWTAPGATPTWQTLTASLDLPKGTRSLKVELQPGTGRATGDVAMADLDVSLVSAGQRALRSPAVSPVVRAEPHPLVRSVRGGNTHRPALVVPAKSRISVPLPERHGPVTLTTAVALPRMRVPSHTAGCWSIAPLPAHTGEEAHGCVAPGKEWAPVSITVSPDAEAVLLSTTPKTAKGKAKPYGPVAFADPWLRSDDDTPEDPRPDIVLVVIDTLRADGLGVTGAPHPSSPTLDALAAEAHRYSRAMAASSWTLPSLASVVTGRWPHEHEAGFRARHVAVSGASGSHAWKTQTFQSMSRDVPTLAERLRAAGYCTEGVVTNFFFGATYGFQRGFQSYTQYNGNSIPGAERLLELVGEDDSCVGPRFTVLHFFEPHMPVRLRSDGPQDFTDPRILSTFHVTTETESLPAQADRAPRTAQVLDKLRRTEKEQVDTLRGIYDAETWHADRVLGELLPKLAPPGTGLVVLSDHGEHMGEDRYWGHGTSMRPPLVHVPLIVRPPDHTGPGKVVDTPVSLVDVAPTVLDWAGALDGATVDGVVLDGAPPTDRTLWATHTYKNAERFAAIRGDTFLERTLGRGIKDPLARRRGDQWTATDVWFGADDSEGWERSKPDAALADALSQHIGATLPGLHVRCPRDPRATSVRRILSETGSVVRVTPIEALASDSAVGDRSGRMVTATLAAGDADFWVVVETEPASEVTATGCTVARVGRAGDVAALDSEAMEALEAIGYME